MQVSVVIPAYNEEFNIADCLEALSKQLEKPYEIIVVDNNCTDKTAQVARSYGARVIRENEQGITPSRNTGFDAAKGDIIARCDADTRPSVDWIARIKRSFDDSSVIGVTGTHAFYDAPARFTRLFNAMFTVVYFEGNRLLLGHEAFYGSNMAIRKSIWEEAKKSMCLDDRLVHEDIDLAIHLSEHGVINYDPELLVGCSFRALKVKPRVIVERLEKWPRTKLVHTRYKRFAKPGKISSSSAQNVTRKSAVKV
jgi:glycosyltransferase involved in cell wall biosynthesis